MFLRAKFNDSRYNVSYGDDHWEDNWHYLSDYTVHDDHVSCEWSDPLGAKSLTPEEAEQVSGMLLRRATIEAVAICEENDHG